MKSHPLVMQEQIDEAWTPSSSPAQCCAMLHTHTQNTFHLIFWTIFWWGEKGTIEHLDLTMLEELHQCYLTDERVSGQQESFYHDCRMELVLPLKSICSQGSFLLKQL